MPTPLPESPETWLQRARQLVADRKLDLSTDEDLSLAVMNLISAEEHLFFSGAKTGDATYYAQLSAVRQLRQHYLRQLLPRYEGEVWCTCKHLLSASMRLLEVGTKRQEHDPDAAASCFRHAYALYAQFWSLKLKMADVSVPPAKATAAVPQPPTNQAAIEEFLTKLVDCCGE